MRRNKLIATVLAGNLLGSVGTGIAQEVPAGGDPAAPAAPATQPADPAAPPATPAPPPPKRVDRPYTPEELRELDEREKDLIIYEGGQAEHADRMKVILRREYEQRRSTIDKKFKQGCSNATKEFGKQNTDSKRLLEDFLAKYPDDPAWTPDIMFRLAKLLYFQINGDYNEKQSPPCNDPTLLDPNKPPVATIDVDGDGIGDGPDYTPAIELWKGIATRFPDYRLLDGTLYLWAYVSGESPPFGMARPAEAKPVWLGLVCRNKFDPLTPPAAPPDPSKPLPACPQPDAKLLAENPYAGCEPIRPGSKLVDEAWVRIADNHFNARCELPQAIAAYKQVIDDEKSDYYDNALYMLAWSYYRFNQYEDAISHFDKFVVSSDRKEAEGGSQLDLRKEAVQYLAISFADPRPPETLSNPVSAMQRLNGFYKDRTGEKHVRDVYEEMGKVIKTNAGVPTGEGAIPEDMYIAYGKAIEAWRYAIDNYPLHPRNPIIHQDIVDLLELMGDKNAEVAERQRIAELYKKGSPWYRANEMNRDAMAAAETLSENSLIKAAVQTHRRAQEERVAWERGKSDQQILTVRDAGRQAYMDLYASAGQMYEAYLVQYPTSKQLYEFTYRLGDTYFYSEQFDKAVENYRWVRDHGNMGTQYKDRSVKRIVESRRVAVDFALNMSPPTLVEPPLPDAAAVKANPTAKDIPKLWLDLQQALDEYAQWVPGDPDASKQALSSAMISYKHFQLDDALKRFTVVFDKFCNTPEAVQAKDGMLVIYEARGQEDLFLATNEKFAARKCGTPDQVALADAQNKALRYRQARKIFDEAEALEKAGQSGQQKFLEAGQAFYAYFVEVSFDNPDKDDALFAAAVAFSRGGRPKTAISLYQIFLDTKEFKGSEYYVEAVFLIAKNYQNAFQYEEAADKFLEVYKLAGEKNRKSQKSFDLKQARLDSLYNAAYLREVDRVYFDRSRNDQGAIALYKQYAKEETDFKKAADGYFRIALIYKKLGKTGDMLKEFAAWRKTYAKDPAAAPSIGLNYVMTFYEEARLARTPKAQAPLWNATIAAYDKVFNDAVAARFKDADKAAYDRANIVAREWAGEAQFRLSDQFYKEKFEPFKFKWQKLDLKNPEKLQKAIDASYKALYDIHEKTIREFLKVSRFQSTWSLAALVRVGDVSFFAGDKLFSAGLPKEIEAADLKFPDLGLAAQFTETVETKVRLEFVEPEDTKAFPFGAKQYWQLTLESAKKNEISNEWSKLAAERLNTYIASDLYPVQRDDQLDPEVKP